MMVQGNSPLRTWPLAGPYLPRHRSAKRAKSTVNLLRAPSVRPSRTMLDLQSTDLPPGRR